MHTAEELIIQTVSVPKMPFFSLLEKTYAHGQLLILLGAHATFRTVYQYTSIFWVSMKYCILTVLLHNFLICSTRTIIGKFLF